MAGIGRVGGASGGTMGTRGGVARLDIGVGTSRDGGKLHAHRDRAAPSAYGAVVRSAEGGSL